MDFMTVNNVATAHTAYQYRCYRTYETGHICIQGIECALCSQQASPPGSGGQMPTTGMSGMHQASMQYCNGSPHAMAKKIHLAVDGPSGTRIPLHKNAL